MKQAKEEKLIGNNKKIALRQILNQNSFQDSNQLQIKKNNLSSNTSNHITPAQALREISKGSISTTQQNKAPKNVWMSSFRDIVRDEPVKIAQIKKTAAEPIKKNAINKPPPVKPKNIVKGNQSSKPVFTMSASLKNSMQQQSPTIKDKSNISQNQNMEQNRITSLNNVETPKIPQKVTKPAIGITPKSLSINQSPSISTNRCPSPVRKSETRSSFLKKNNRLYRALCVFVFLIFTFLVMFFIVMLL